MDKFFFSSKGDSSKKQASSTSTSAPPLFTKRTSFVQSNNVSVELSVPIDSSQFTSPTFSPSAFLSSALSSDSERSVHALKAKLSTFLDKQNQDIRECIYSKYKELVSALKEIAKLESELTSLRSALNEIKESSTTFLPSSSTVAAKHQQHQLSVDLTESSRTSFLQQGDEKSTLHYPKSIRSSFHNLTLGLNNEREEEDIPQSNLKQFSELIDSLDESIALCDYDRAIDAIDSTKSLLSLFPTDSSTTQSLKANVVQRIETLLVFMTHELSSPMISKRLVTQFVVRFSRLGRAERAREIFLASRSTFIRQKTRRLKFEGDITRYITQLSILFFSIIKSTCEWYATAFEDPIVTAGFVVWAREELDAFANIFRKQVFQPSVPMSVIAECLKASQDHGRALKEAGLDLGYVLEGIFVTDVEAVLGNFLAVGK